MCLVSCRLQSRLEDMKIGYRLPENNYSQQAIDFMDKVLDISGLGDATFLSDGGCLLLHARAAVHTCMLRQGVGAGCLLLHAHCCWGRMHGALRGRRVFASDVVDLHAACQQLGGLWACFRLYVLGVTSACALSCWLCPSCCRTPVSCRGAPVRCADVVLGRDAKVKVTWEGARKETETCLNVCIQHVLNRTGIKAKQVTPHAPRA